MGAVETPEPCNGLADFHLFSSFFAKPLQTSKMSEAQDAFIIFDEAYEGNDVDAFYLGDILRALGCNVTNAAVASHGGAEELGQKRIAFADFGAILTADKDGSGKVPLPEIKNVLCSLGEKLDNPEADKLCDLLGIVADEEDMVSYMDFIDKLLAATA